MSKIVTVSHQKGGVGKSTLAFNLAQNISNNARVCILDFDKQGSLLSLSNMCDFDILENVEIENIKEQLKKLKNDE